MELFPDRSPVSQDEFCLDLTMASLASLRQVLGSKKLCRCCENVVKRMFLKTTGTCEAPFILALG